MLILPASRVNDMLMAQRKQWHVLSVCREDELPMTVFAKSHCHLNCDDVCEADLPRLVLEQQGGGELRIPPNRGHAVMIGQNCIDARRQADHRAGTLSTESRVSAAAESVALAEIRLAGVSLE